MMESNIFQQRGSLHLFLKKNLKNWYKRDTKKVLKNPTGLRSMLGWQ